MFPLNAHIDPQMQQEKGIYNRYINLLGIEESPPTLFALSALVHAHLSAIPFENISKLYYASTSKRNQLPSLAQYLKGIEDFHFGGTCYANNYHFFKLLQFMGYQAQLCAADMKKPHVHMVIKVRLEDREYLVDVGYAAPFLHAIPLYLKKDHVVVCGWNRYVIKPRDHRGCNTVLMYQGHKRKHGYTIKPEARTIEDFQPVIHNSFRADANFLNLVLITKHISGRFCTLHNLEYTEAIGTEIISKQILQANELAKKVEAVFKIPANMTSRSIGGIKLSADAWS